MVSIGSFTLTDTEVRRRRAFLEIGPADEARLKEGHSRLQRFADEIIERFYEYLLAQPHTREVLQKEPGLVERLKALQGRYFLQLTAGEYGLEYFENRLKVGQAHHRIGLSPEWYLGAYVKYLHIVSDVLSRSFGRDYEGFYQTILSLTKVIYLDMGLAIDAYHYAAQEGLERKNVELASANAELRRVQAAKQQLADLIIHDLQNPLAGIQSVLQVLAAGGAGLTAEQREAIGEALVRCNDLSQMILNVLHVSRAEKGELQALIETVELGDLSRSVAKEFDRTAALGGRSLLVQSPASVRVRTDPALVRRVLQNLIRNALRHTPQGTVVELCVESASRETVRLSVVDDGPGIPVELQAQLFEPFGAATLRAAGRSVDTGLGLASCRAAARAMGTDIGVVSDGRRGTTFFLDLPVA